MKMITIMATLLAFAVLAGPAVVESTAAGPKEGIDVNIVNPPVPVVGPRTGMDVNILNTPVPVVMDNQGTYKRLPFSKIETVSLPIGDYFNIVFIEVPEEYLLVIETVSARCHFTLGKQPILFEIWTNLGSGTGTGAVLRIPLTKQWEHAESGDSEWVGTLQVRVYVGAGSTYSLRAYRSPDEVNSYAFCDCSWYGYLIDPDSPGLGP